VTGPLTVTAQDLIRDAEQRADLAEGRARLLEQQLEHARNTMTLLQRLHDSHINAEIMVNNTVVTWLVADPLHADRCRRGTADSIEIAECRMAAAAVELFPESKFAKNLEDAA
jgi:hypothetical protein